VSLLALKDINVLLGTHMMKVVLETRRAQMMKVMLETRRAHMMKVTFLM
jgi:hypothetical protein